MGAKGSRKNQHLELSNHKDAVKALENFEQRIIAKNANGECKFNNKSTYVQDLIAADKANRSKTRRLVSCGISDDTEAPHDMFAVFPVLVFMMLMIFIFRQPLRRFFAEASKKASNVKKDFNYGSRNNL